MRSIFRSYFSLSLNFFLACFLPFFTMQLSGATIIVGPPPASIQTAVDSASSGDTIQLSAGTYVEEVHIISKSLNLFGAGENMTTIQSPSATTHLTQNFSYGGSNWWCIVMVDNQAAPTPQTVNISDLTVDGSNQQDTSLTPIYGSSDRFFAIGYHNANGTVQNVHTTNTRQTVNFNEVTGGGIVNASDTGVVTFNVTNCLIDFYQRIGIDCRGSALTASVANNMVNRGYVLTPNTSTATPNGIQFSGSATGSITNNIVLENIATVLGASATGIIPFGAGANLVVSGNTVNNNDTGIAAISCGNNLTISNNTINFTMTPGVNPDEGIVVQDTNGLTTITANIMNNIPNINMEIIASTDQPFQLMDNQFIGSQTGLIVTGNTTTGPIVTMNSDSFTGTSGYYIQEVTAPNNIWPSTATVSFDGLISGHMTIAEFNFVLTKIFDKHNDPALGLVLDFITPTSPILSGLNPTFGPTTGGNLVTITGSSFISSNTQVFFGSTPATNVTVLSDLVLTATAPPGTGTVDVTVFTSFGVTPIVSADQYTYIPPLPIEPQITGINPNFGPSTGENIITIIGANFVEGNTQVFFGSSPAIQVTVLSSTLLTVTVPPGMGTVDITVVTPFGSSAITPDDSYTYLTIPPSPPLPPSYFKGYIEKTKCQNKKYTLKATWKPSLSTDVTSYRIYKKGSLVEEVPAESPLLFMTCLSSKKWAKEFSISAVNSSNLESQPIIIKIVQGE